MKPYVYVVFVLMLLFTFSSPAQAQEIPKKQEVIVISFDKDADSAFKTTGRLLAKEGFKLATAEPTLMLLSTEPTERSLGIMQDVLMQINAEVDGTDSTSTVTVTGLWADPIAFQATGAGDPVLSSNGRAIRYGNRAERKVFNHVVKIFESIEGATISYPEPDSE